jgi:two-component system, LytTR family, response regulator LytT
VRRSVLFQRTFGEQTDILMAAANPDCIYTRNEQTCMVTTGGVFLITRTLEQLQTELDPADFYRVNRQYIVSYQYIKEIEQISGRKIEILLTIDHDDQIIVSKDTASAFKTWMEER